MTEIPEYGTPLKPLQHNILRLLIVEGMTIAQVAKKVFKSVETVKYHVYVSKYKLFDHDEMPSMARMGYELGKKGFFDIRESA